VGDWRVWAAYFPPKSCLGSSPLTKSKKGYKLDLYENNNMKKDIKEMMMEILHNLETHPAIHLKRNWMKLERFYVNNN
jgi:hypothetical protein